MNTIPKEFTAIQMIANFAIFAIIILAIVSMVRGARNASPAEIHAATASSACVKDEVQSSYEVLSIRELRDFVSDCERLTPG